MFGPDVLDTSIYFKSSKLRAKFPLISHMFFVTSINALTYYYMHGKKQSKISVFNSFWTLTIKVALNKPRVIHVLNEGSDPTAGIYRLSLVFKLHSFAENHFTACRNFNNPIYLRFNSYLPGNPYKGHRQTVQTQIRRHILWRLIRTILFANKLFQQK